MKFKPLRWAEMPMSAKKCHLRLARAFPKTDGRINGWEWFSTLAERSKVYAVSRDWRWFVAHSDDGCASFD